MRFPDREETPGRFPPNLSLSLSLCLSLLFTACLEDTPPVRDTTIHLSVVHEGTFSIHLRVSVADSSDIWTFELTRDDSVVNTTTTHHSQLTISDGGLNPGQTYRYRAHRLIDGEIAASSAEVSAATLDTTSHAFIWEIDTLGDYGSYLNDIAIIDEDNIWVVGNINTDSGEYNVARWNGEQWELLGIYSNTLDLYSIWYFAEDDIWVLASYPIHWDGNEWTHYHLTDMGIIPGGLRGEIWGANPNNIYFVGAYGRIVHYDGSGFARMESGTDVDLKDIDGTPDGEHVFAIGWDSNLPAPCVVLELTSGEWNTLYYIEGAEPSNGNVGWVWSVGVLHDTVYLPTSAGLWKYNYITGDSVVIPNQVSHMDITAFKRIHVINTNDIFLGGSGFIYAHYNGITYHYSKEINNLYLQRALKGSDYKNDLAFMVGWFNWWEGALIVKGYHE